MNLKLTFATAEQGQSFLKQTGEKSLDTVNIGLINFALSFEGLTSHEVVGDPIEFNVKNADGTWTTEIIADPIARIQNGEVIEPNTPVKMLGEMDVAAATETNWALNRIANRYLPFVQNPYFATIDEQRTVEVIIMDSGVMKTHDELSEAVIEDLYFVPAFADTDDELGHGTAIAGLVAGKTLGVNKQAKLKIVKISSDTRKPTLGELADAFDAVITYHASTPEIPKVLNLSWRIPTSAYINEKITALIDAGVLVVAAAGNEAMNIDTITPAGTTGVFTVAGSTMEDEELYAVYGIAKNINVYAPGESVNVPSIFDATSYGSSTGSSFSAALVSGVASILFGLRSTAPLSTDVADAIVSDSTYNALIVNDHVEQAQNRLLHRPDTNSLPDNNVQYLGVNTLDGAADMKVDVKMLMPISVMNQTAENNTDFTLNFGDSEIEAIMNQSSVSDNGLVLIKITPGTTLGAGQKVKQMWFTVTLQSPGITFVSPKIYFFLVTQDAIASDIKPMLDELSASSSFTFLEEVDQESNAGKGGKS
jgi:hypothetical protein